MAIAIGTQLGSHEITALLGKGGMGEVYRARDTKLKREVAIKILPEEFSRDGDRVSRFQREAEVLASLNHPNIAGIYDLAEASGTRFLVLELVEGETLADRIAQGPIPVEEALALAKQICEALEAAHERGIIHRDLKPANVKITSSGKVKVLDFGLAKATDASPTSAALSNFPTMLSGTMRGLIIGTAAYMSPEQAKGRPVDRRTDIFAFGCVLYEMLAGRPVFEGEEVAEILAQVLTRDPDWTRLPTHVPLRIRELLRFCLQKDVKKRRSDAADLRIDIEEAMTEPEAVASAVAPGRQLRLAWGVAAVASFLLAVLAAVHFREKAPESPEMRLEISTPSTSAPLEFALSPDGRYIVFVASGNGPQRLWLRALDKTDAQPMSGTEGANDPFWSADSRSIGFTATGKLKRIDIAGGPPQELANTSVPRTGAWNGSGTILFSASVGPLLRIASSGGEPVAVTRFDARQSDHRFPQFLPDGRHFVFYAAGTPDGTGIYLGSLDGGESKRLAGADTAGVYLAPGRIAFVRQSTLFAQHLDLERAELTGDPIRVADSVATNGVGFGGFSASVDGRLAYRGGAGLRQLTWYNRVGKVVGVAGESDPYLFYPELSPDGRRVALQRSVTQNFVDVWLTDLVRGGTTRFTFDPAIDGAPLWSPDGISIAFASNRKGPYGLYLKPSSGAGAEQLLLETPNHSYPQDWSKDGRFLLYSQTDPKTGRDLWALPMTGNDRKPIAVVNTRFEELNGQFSPDGRWVAYETNESGRFEIIVQPFPVPSSKWPVSTGGGIQPRWRADGKELYFIGLDRKLMAASVTASGVTFAVGTPVALFPAPPLVPGAGFNKHQYAVSSDGRFLINQAVEESTTTPITVILNLHPERGR
jgi:serine/threonine protein kinase/Tol biopolymer transport system component